MRLTWLLIFMLMSDHTIRAQNNISGGRVFEISESDSKILTNSGGARVLGVFLAVMLVNMAAMAWLAWTIHVNTHDMYLSPKTCSNILECVGVPLIVTVLVLLMWGAFFSNVFPNEKITPAKLSKSYQLLGMAGLAIVSFLLLGAPIILVSVRGNRSTGFIVNFFSLYRILHDVGS